MIVKILSKSLIATHDHHLLALNEGIVLPILSSQQMQRRRCLELDINRYIEHEKRIIDFSIIHLFQGLLGSQAFMILHLINKLLVLLVLVVYLTSYFISLLVINYDLFIVCLHHL